MKMDVYADLEHLFMLNFSVDAAALEPLVRAPLTLHTTNGRAFPSIVLPRIRRLRPTALRWPRVDYELYGLRILVEYDSTRLGPTKGIWFARLIMDPAPARVAGNLVTNFDFRLGTIEKREEPSGWWEITVRDAGGAEVVGARARPGDAFPERLPPGSAFGSMGESLAKSNDIAYGFLPMDDGSVHVLQIAHPHPDYEKWPLTHLELEEVRVPALDGRDVVDGAEMVREPCFHVGFLPRYWRWLPTERR